MAQPSDTGTNFEALGDARLQVTRLKVPPIDITDALPQVFLQLKTRPETPHEPLEGCHCLINLACGRDESLTETLTPLQASATKGIRPTTELDSDQIGVPTA